MEDQGQVAPAWGQDLVAVTAGEQALPAEEMERVQLRVVVRVVVGQAAAQEPAAAREDRVVVRAAEEQAGARDSAAAPVVEEQVEAGQSPESG